MELKRFDFDYSGCDKVGSVKHGVDWPVVYLINGPKEMYVGETSSFQGRFRQHLGDEKKANLSKISFVDDADANKSLVLDLEQKLIRLCSADGKFTLTNANAGQSARHDYANKSDCEKKIREIWGLMSNENLTNHSYEELINTNIFKYSPYTVLTEEQNAVSRDVLRFILNGLKDNMESSALVMGSAGTGKTIVALNMIFTLLNIGRMNHGYEFNLDNEWHVLIRDWQDYVREHGVPKIAFVVPMQSIRATLAEVVEDIGGDLGVGLVVGPTAVVKNQYDIVFVDESHRLKKRKNIVDYKNFDDCCRQLNLDSKKANQLDWIVNRCKQRVLFYDATQSIKSADVTPQEYERSLNAGRINKYLLKSQMRCLGGDDYIDYVNDVFALKNPLRKTFRDYEVETFNKASAVVSQIQLLERKHKLCRVVAGYSWEWKTKKYTLQEIKKNNLYDIDVDGNQYIWNTTDKNWILSDNAINEIGCVHTIQGYDLNYVGIIFGKEIDYDEMNNRFVVNLNEFYDVKVKSATSPEKVQEYIVNAYKVMMMRGIKGCYLYACNPRMQNFLKKYF